MAAKGGGADVEAAVPPEDAAPRIFGRVPPVLVALDDAVLGGHPDQLEATIVTQQGHENARIKVRGASDIASVAGSGVGLCFFIVLAALHLYIFANKDPQVNDYFVQTSNRGRDGQSVALARGAYFNGTKQTKGEFRYNVDVEDEPVVEWLLPDVAISMRSPAKSEAEFLQYVWPDFIWSNDEVDPLSSRNEKIDEPLPVKLGSEDCQLDFYGESVFCVRGSPKRVRGWFGEPEWNYLTIKLWPCGSNYTNSDMELGKDFPVDQGSPPHHPALHAQWKKGGGACKSPEDIKKFISDVTFNFWMRLEREDFNRLDWGQGNKNNYNGGLLPPPGLLDLSKRVSSSSEDPEAWQVDPNQKTLTPGWEWYVYESLFPDATIDNLYIDLQHNTAEVNGVFNLPGLGRRIYTFFSYNRGDYLYSKLPRQSLYGFELLDIKTRVANRRRVVEVQPATIWQTIADVSGSWGACLLLAVITCHLWEKVTDRGAPKIRDVLISAYSIEDADNPAGNSSANMQRNSSLPVPQTTPPLFRGGVVGPAHLTASPAFQGDMIRRYPAGAAGGLIWPGMSMH